MNGLVTKVIHDLKIIAQPFQVKTWFFKSELDKAKNNVAAKINEMILEFNQLLARPASQELNDMIRSKVTKLKVDVLIIVSNEKSLWNQKEIIKTNFDTLIEQLPVRVRSESGYSSGVQSLNTSTQNLSESPSSLSGILLEAREIFCNEGVAKMHRTLADNTVNASAFTDFSRMDCTINHTPVAQHHKDDFAYFYQNCRGNTQTPLNYLRNYYMARGFDFIRASYLSVRINQNKFLEGPSIGISNFLLMDNALAIGGSEEYMVQVNGNNYSQTITIFLNQYFKDLSSCSNFGQYAHRIIIELTWFDNIIPTLTKYEFFLDNIQTNDKPEFKPHLEELGKNFAALFEVTPEMLAKINNREQTLMKEAYARGPLPQPQVINEQEERDQIAAENQQAAHFEGMKRQECYMAQQRANAARAAAQPHYSSYDRPSRTGADMFGAPGSYPY